MAENIAADPAPSTEFVGAGGLSYHAAAIQPGVYNPDSWTPPSGFNPRDLTGDERAALRDAAGSHEPGAMRQAYQKIYDARRSGQPTAPEQPGGQAAQAQPAQTPAAQDRPIAAKLGEVLGDKAGGLAMIDSLAPQVERVASHLAFLSPADIDASWQKVESTIYRGSVAEQEAGMQAIATAIEQVGGRELVELIERSGVLADPGVHLQLLNLARQISKQGARR